MANDQLVSDLDVKSLVVKKQSGSNWASPPESHFVVGACYRLDALFGNSDGRISYPEAKYQKQNVEIRVVAKGFGVFGVYTGKEHVQFYKAQDFTEIVNGPGHRTTFTLPVFDTTNADVLLCAYMKVNAASPIHVLVWDVGIYAAVRDFAWRSTATGV